MLNKKKKIALLCSATALGILTCVTISTNPNFGNFTTALLSSKDVGISFSNDNGAIAVTSLKTNFVDANTNSNNTVKVAYKNCAVTSGKIGTVKANGYYGNEDPICGIESITVTSSAAAGDAVIKYGKTSACLDGSVDLASGTVSGIYANYFKIVATKDVAVESIAIDFTCANDQCGFVALYGETDKTSGFKFQNNSGEYDLMKTDASTSSYVNKFVVPDFYVGDNGYQKVTRIMNTGSYGIFEKTYNLEEVYWPETIKQWGSYFFNASQNSLKSFTFPRDLTTVSYGTLVPSSTSLTTVYYNSKNLTYSGSSGFNSSYQANLKSIYVSYDVESLPNSLISSLPTGVTIYYEGTEAEWATLTASASNWNKATYIICSDTVTATSTFIYENSSLNGDTTGSYSVRTIVGNSVSDPGIPVWTGSSPKQVFNGWYTQPTGGEKVTFPVTASADATYYAQFVDMPVGYSLDDPINVTFGTYDYSTRSDLGSVQYYKFTATEDEVVHFELNNIDCDDDDGAFKVYDGDGNEITLGSMSYSAERSVQDVAYLCDGNEAVVKIRFKAGESYTIAASVSDFDPVYGTAKFNVVDAAAIHADYTAAVDYELGTQFTAAVPANNTHYWQKFVPTESGTYTIEFNNIGGANVTTTIGHFEDGTWKQDVGGNYSASTKFGEFTKGTTYYIASTESTGTGNFGFKITKGTPDGYSASNPITITVDGDAVANKNNGFYWNYYTFTVATDGYYKVVSGSLNLSTSSSQSYSSSQSTQYIQVSASSEITDAISCARTYDASTSSKELVYNLTAGTYYMKATVYSSSNDLSIVSVADPEGLTVNTPKAITLTSGTAIDTSDAGDNGKFYSFVADSEDWYVFTAATTATVKLGTKTSSGLISYFSTSATMSSGDLHKKLTVGNTYLLFVKGTTSVSFATAESVQDGTSAETAYEYTLGTEEKTVSDGGRVKSTTTYFYFTPSETGSYMATTKAYYSSQFAIKNGSSSVSTSSTSGNDKFYNLTAGIKYTIEAYSYGFTIVKTVPGINKDNAISITVDPTAASFTLDCTLGTSGTWYTFTNTGDKAWWEFTLTDGFTGELYIGSSTTKAGSLSTTSVTKSIAAGATVYIKIIGTADATATVNVAHPETYEDGLTIETAKTFVGDFMEYSSTKGETTDSSGYFYIKVNVEANTEYVIYSVSGNDIDFGAVYYAANTSSSLTTSYSDNDIGSSDSDTWGGNPLTLKDAMGTSGTMDTYARFNSGEYTTLWIKLRQYTPGTYNINIHFLTANAFFGTAA